MTEVLRHYVGCSSYAGCRMTIGICTRLGVLPVTDPCRLVEAESEDQSP